MSHPIAKPRNRRVAAGVAAIVSASLLLAACSSSDTSDDNASDQDARPRVGVILGGGGEVGIAWQLGVLDALQNDAGLDREAVDVVVGTSAGAFSATSFLSVDDLGPLVETERNGQGASAPVAGGEGPNAIPPELVAALSSTEGTVEERAKRAGALAIEADLPITDEQYVQYVGTAVPSADWPAGDLRITSVNAETGKTVLWDKNADVPLPAALASSSAVPGFLPAVEIDGGFYTDVPRTSFSAKLAADKNLDAIIYIGMPTPNLSNTVEEDALEELESQGVEVIRVLGSQEARAVAANALDPSQRPAAVELGSKDGQAVVAAVRSLLR